MDMSIRRFQQLSLNSSSSGEEKSSDTVFSNQDLLTLILLRVPVRKLLHLKRVSKQWLSLITSSQFSLLHSKLPGRATGLFVQQAPVPHLQDKVYLCPLDDNHRDCGGSSPVRFPTCAHRLIDPDCIRIMQSCHGLYLCCGSLFDRQSISNYYIYNPTTNQLAILPKHNYDVILCSNLVLAFDPSNSPHYKVFACVGTSQMRSRNLRWFNMYSSETRNWRTVLSDKPFSEPPNVIMLSLVYCNGCIHWIGKNGADSLYFNVDEERLETFPRPPIDPISSSRRSLYFGESEGHLHVIEVFPSTTSLDVYEMKSDHSGYHCMLFSDFDL